MRALLVALALAGLLAAGCGGDSEDDRLLTRRQANELRGTLAQVEENVAAKNCTGAEQQVAALQDQIDQVRRVDRDLRSALRSGARRLETLVSSDCETTTTPPVETTPTTPEEGASGPTGPEGDKETPKKEKPPKKDEEPETDEEPLPDEPDEGGGAGPPDETDPDGGTLP
jgi:hypothetical protein